MKRLKRFLAVVLTGCMILGFGITAMAADDTPHFTFTNIREDQPDLYVTKSVSSALDGYYVPDGTVFTFVLKWDADGDGYLEFADNVSYFLYDAMGVQVMNPDTSDGSYKTTSTGRFTLAGGQYARFEWAGQVEYQISEESLDGFTQILPAGGADATGTVAADGTVVEFENLYVPVVERHEDTLLAIRKEVSWPDGCEMPEFADTYFTFEIKVDGDIYGNEYYTLYNSDLSETIENGYTDENGMLAIVPGTVAVFDDIDVGVDYEISEVGMDTGWRAVGQTVSAGSTTAPITYNYFTNAGAAFVVEKDRTDGITGLDDEFTFVLSSGGSPVENAGYYLYDARGSLVSGDALYTDESGRFILKAGQKAVFFGLAEGAEYTVSEEEIDGFAEVAAQDVTVGFDSVSCISFTNEQLSNVSIKKMVGNSGNRTLAGAEFTIYDAENNVVDVRVTGEDGMLTFSGLSAGEYRISETKTPDGYQSTGEDICVTLPYVMTAGEVADAHINTESEDFMGLYGSGVYYFYDMTYDVYNNMAVLDMPNTGGWAWFAFICVAAGIAAAAVSVTMYRHNKKSLA